MAKVLYSATMSLDGFIAGPGGDMSWMKPFFEPDEETDELAADIGALLVGNRTHRGDDPNRGTENEGAFGGTWDGPYFLLTHHPSITPEPGVTVVHDLESGLAAAKPRPATSTSASSAPTSHANVSRSANSTR